MKIALFGASGRLGRSIATLISQEPDLVLSDAIVHGGSASLGTQNYSDTLQNQPDLLIDVSLAKGFPGPLETALKIKKPIVIGITGLSYQQIELIRKASNEIPIFYSPNFSLGMALFQRLCLQAAKSFYPSSTLDLFEMHHAEKKDSPSGSAQHLSNDLKAIGKDAQIYSVRSGKIIGEHKLLLNSDEERLEIAHVAHSRDAFARGALAAARFLATQKPALYGMDDLIL